MARDTLSSVTDNVMDNLAIYSNEKKIAIDKLTASVAYSDYATLTTMSGNVTLTDASNPVLSLNTNGSARDVVLPAIAVTNHPFFILNRGAETITVKNAASAVIATVTAGLSSTIVSDGVNAWFSITEKPPAVSVADGWNQGTGTWSYSSADAPTFVISVNNDQTGIISVGMKIRLTQTTAKYFIVTAVGAYSGGETLITVYGGTDYTLANAAITTPYWSVVKAPFGFPMSPIKWTEILTDTTSRTVTTGLTAWQAMPSMSKSVPIGAWRAKLQTLIQCVDTNAFGQVTVSTTTNSESNAEMSAWAVSIGLLQAYLSVVSQSVIVLTSKTTHYILMKGTAGSTALYLRNDFQRLTLSFECAYL